MWFSDSVNNYDTGKMSTLVNVSDLGRLLGTSCGNVPLLVTSSLYRRGNPPCATRLNGVGGGQGQYNVGQTEWVNSVNETWIPTDSTVGDVIRRRREYEGSESRGRSP